MSVFISDESQFQVDFSADPSFAPEGMVTHTLRRAGDYAIWGAGVFHRAFGIRPATILTIRWEHEYGAT
jgi:hypothetical protein